MHTGNTEPRLNCLMSEPTPARYSPLPSILQKTRDHNSFLGNLLCVHMVTSPFFARTC